MTELLNDFLSGSAAWGVLLTLAAFALGTLINRVTGKAELSVAAGYCGAGHPAV